MIEEALRAKVRTALADPRRSLPLDEVFARLRAHHEARLKARNHDIGHNFEADIDVK